jgi:hypothetical protein
MISRRIAYHEAGHAVIARVLGCDLRYVAACRTSDEFAGEAVPVNTSRDPATNYERMAKVKLAGPLAQSKKFSTGVRKTIRRGEWNHDLKDAEELVVNLCICRQFGFLEEREYELNGADLQKLWDTLESDAHKLVDANWPAIVRVAEELMTRPVLFQDDVDALIGRGGTAAQGA